MGPPVKSADGCPELLLTGRVSDDKSAGRIAGFFAFGQLKM
jgi:hypothetical protein